MKKIEQRRLICILAGVCLALLISMCIILGVTGKPKTPAFVPPEFDAAAVAGVPVVSEDLGWKELLDERLSFHSAVCGVIRIKDGRAKIYLTNYAENTLWLKVRVFGAGGKVLGESGLIKPGEYLEEITFDVLPKNGEQITLRLMSYEPETYHSGGAVSLNTRATLEG